MLVDVAAAMFSLTYGNPALVSQVGSPASTPADAVAYAAFCAKLRTALNHVGIRLTIAVADW